ncbi:MAG: 50S ribosomal protein L27 [Patescibacteria group bacterium]
MAHTKAKGTSKLGRDSRSKRLGVKIFGGQKILTGQIIVRQRGSRFFAGEGVGIGGDDTLFAKKEGKVIFYHKNIRHFSNRLKEKTIVRVV